MASSTLPAGREGAKFGAYGFGVVAALCAACVAYLASRLIAAHGLQKEKQLSVVVTTRAISAGEPIVRDALRVATYPESIVPPGAVREIEPLYKSGKAPIAA